MLDALDMMTSVPTFTWVVTALMCGSICWFLQSVVESTGLAIAFAPAVIFGALLSTFLVNENHILLSSDKDSHAVAAAAIGILGALIVMLVAHYVLARVSDARVKAKKVPHALPEHDPT